MGVHCTEPRPSLSSPGKRAASLGFSPSGVERPGKAPQDVNNKPGAEEFKVHRESGAKTRRPRRSQQEASRRLHLVIKGTLKVFYVR